ncbi:hypothetical protein DSO57_1036302 [Entomophthora muscae]|uniref:Uncharacterized protein n=1 Tax=Entomophthora muscae TaxID=34485 RepID=A0ACC2SCA9_9FUNG|nr:hypothetical protein DSO57_1036302 [Entomophthora muscae]
MVAITSVTVFLLFTAIAYLGLGVGIYDSVIFWRSLDAVPSVKTTKKVPSLDIDFKSVNSSDNIMYFKNQLALLNYPGPGISEKVCESTIYFDKHIDLCFWIVKRELLVSDPYYPRLKTHCKHEKRCPLKQRVPVGIPAQFYPQSGLASKIIPLKIDSSLAHYNSLQLFEVTYKPKIKRRLWIRSFFWQYKGAYVLSSRPSVKFNFTFQWPSLLPSGKPKFIYADCQEVDIYFETCSDNAFL